MATTQTTAAAMIAKTASDVYGIEGDGMAINELAYILSDIVDAVGHNTIVSIGLSAHVAENATAEFVSKMTNKAKAILAGAEMDDEERREWANSVRCATAQAQFAFNLN